MGGRFCEFQSGYGDGVCICGGGKVFGEGMGDYVRVC
jgi:hypothetical protein